MVSRTVDSQVTSSPAARVVGPGDGAESHGVAAKSLAEIRPLIAAVPVAVVTLDVFDRVTSWNPCAERIFGWRGSELVGHRNPLSLPGRDTEIDPWRHSLVRGEPILDRRITRRRRDGTMLDLRVSAAPIRDDHDEAAGVVAMLTDVSADRQAEEFVDRYRLLTGMLNDIVLVTDGDGGILEANEAAARAYGWSHEEVASLSFEDICAREEGSPCPTAKVLSSSTPTSFESVHRRKDGSTFPVEVSMVAGEIAGDRVAIAVIRDITARRRREAARELLHDIDRWLLQNRPVESALESTCRRLAAIYDLAVVSIFLRDADGMVRSRAASGPEASYLDEIVVRCDETPEGKGPIGTAIRTCTPIRAHIDTDPSLAPWRERALVHGLRSVAAIPVPCVGEPRGALALWSKRRDAVGEDEVAELIGFANQVSVSLVAAEARERIVLQSVALDAAANAVVITDRDGVIRSVNPAFTRLTGWEAEEAVGKTSRILRSGHHGPAFYRQMWETILAGHPWQGELYNKRKDGRIYVEEMTITPVKGEGGEIRSFVAIKQDITSRKKHEEEVRHLATHDPLTGLPNRRALEDALARVTARVRRGSPAAVFILDVDNFKAVNDTVGHLGGDDLLCRLARQLREVLRPTDLLARFGGDEFAVVLDGASLEEACAAAERLRSSVDRSRFEHDGHPFALSVSIGLSLVDGELGGAAALARADSALYLAKEGKNRIVVFDEENPESGLAEVNRQASRIKDALREDRFVLHFQPVVRLGTKVREHYEALLRMRGDGGEVLPPSAFLPAAERFGLMPEIDRWVIDRVGETLASRPEARIFVNLSAYSLGDEKLLEHVEAMVARIGIRPGHLVFEITETAAVRDLSLAQRWMRRLRDVGCLFALDDFGTGFSSFSYLQALPADFIKIDGAFVREIDTDRTNRALVQALQTLARTLGKEVIAECVETEAVERILHEIGVDHGQGFRWGRPLEGYPTH